EVVARRDAMRRELADLEGGDERLVALEREQAAARASFVAAAQTLGQARRHVATDFARQLERTLAELAPDRTRFEARFTADPLPESAWSAGGADQAEFFVSPNPGEELRPL